MKQPLQDKSPALAKEYNYLALGDSYTAGEKVAAHENFPNQVTAILRDKGYDFRDPTIVAQTGWTTEELQGGINKLLLNTDYDFVTLLIGVNNQYRGKKTDQYITEFETLLQQAVQFARNDSGRVFILSIPDWGATPYAKDRDGKQISKEIDQFNSANQQVAGKYKVHYIDITQSTRKAATDSSLLTTDGLHPSGKEYSKWAKQVADLFQKKL